MGRCVRGNGAAVGLLWGPAASGGLNGVVEGSTHSPYSLKTPSLSLSVTFAVSASSSHLPASRSDSPPRLVKVELEKHVLHEDCAQAGLDAI